MSFPAFSSVSSAMKIKQTPRRERTVRERGDEGGAGAVTPPRDWTVSWRGPQSVSSSPHFPSGR